MTHATEVNATIVRHLTVKGWHGLRAAPARARGTAAA